jgi:hypothetical protein
MLMRRILSVLIVVVIGLLVTMNLIGDRTETPQKQDDQPEAPETPEESTEEPDLTLPEEEEYVSPSRYSKIPDDLIKILPEDDLNPPVSESDEYYDPVTVPGLVNTPGGEDSSFILPNGDTLYFFFTPDVGVPVERQIVDEVTGIYKSTLIGGEWSESARVLLQDSDKLAVDGCEVVVGDTMYFCSAREGYTGLHWFKAELKDDKWINWVCVDDWMKTFEYEVGELHFSADLKTLYFHSSRGGGKGGYDIWVSEWDNGEWGYPVNLEIVNSMGNEGWPCLSPDETELWFSRDYGVWRSKLVDGEWSMPERMFFPLAGEPTVDSEGNVYFTHHFFDGDVMLEADIYVAYKKT